MMYMIYVCTIQVGRCQVTGYDLLLSVAKPEVPRVTSLLETRSITSLERSVSLVVTEVACVPVSISNQQVSAKLPAAKRAPV